MLRNQGLMDFVISTRSVKYFTSKFIIGPTLNMKAMFEYGTTCGVLPQNLLLDVEKTNISSINTNRLAARTQG